MTSLFSRNGQLPSVDVVVHDDGVEVRHLRRPLLWYVECALLGLGIAATIAAAILAIAVGVR